jgi:hypothetical protein
MVIMTVAAAGLIIGAGTAAVDPQEQGRIGQSEGQEVRALHVPYRADTKGLSRLITVNRNSYSTAVACACHVVPKL